jgi:hypothetical protein
MGQTYTVQSTKRLEGADSYGNVTDAVTFNGVNGSALFRHQPTTNVEVGSTLFGNIETKTSQAGKPYTVFRREKQEFGGPAPAATGTPAVGYNKPAGRDNSDGMRQGMSINNATAIVLAYIRTGVYSEDDPDKLAKDIEAYARAIYSIDLTAENTEDVDVNKSNEALLADMDLNFPEG